MSLGLVIQGEGFLKKSESTEDVTQITLKQVLGAGRGEL